MNKRKMDYSKTKLISIEDAAVLMGMKRSAMNRKIANGKIETFPDPRDRRFRFIRMVDLHRLNDAR